MEDKGPGSVISPDGVDATQKQPEPQQALPQPVPEQPITPAPQAPSPSMPSDEPMQSPQPANSQEPSLSWTASEYLHHDKTAKWYLAGTFGAAVIAAIVYFATRDVVSAGIVFVALAGLVVFAARQPKVQDYAVEGNAIRVGNKVYALSDFKSFSFSEDATIIEVSMVPLKRFMPMVTIHVDPEQVDSLIDHLVAYLPMEQHKADPMDGLLKRLRF